VVHGDTDPPADLRFLVVHQNYSNAARELLEAYPSANVALLIVRRDENAPGQEEAEMLKAHPDARTAAPGVHRKYRKALSSTFRCRLEYEPNAFRADDQQLHAWLRGPTTSEATETPPLPAVAFARAVAEADRMVLADNALARANEIAEVRHDFTLNAANALAELANAQGETGQSLDTWFSARHLHFANSGGVTFQYRRRDGGEGSRKTQRHLKSGDATTPQAAARIYFDLVGASSGAVYVVAFYVGPHPADGSHVAEFTLPA
jgi:hypothetical protein